MKALMAGCGKMGGAMLRSWLKAKIGSFTAVDPRAAEVVPEGARGLSSPEELGDDRFDVLICAVKPQMLEDVLPAYRGRLKPEGFAVSIMAGVSARRVSEALGGVPVVRVMPNLPAAIGKGVSALYAAEGVSEGQKAQAQVLVQATGTAVWTETEDGVDRFTAVAGSGPGYVFEILRAYVKAAMVLGFDEERARAMVLGTVIGTAEMAKAEGRPLEELRDDVTSPGGTTQAGLDAFRRDGLMETLMGDTLKAAYDRAVELR